MMKPLVIISLVLGLFVAWFCAPIPESQERAALPEAAVSVEKPNGALVVEPRTALVDGRQAVSSLVVSQDQPQEQHLALQALSDYERCLEDLGGDAEECRSLASKRELIEAACILCLSVLDHIQYMVGYSVTLDGVMQSYQEEYSARAFVAGHYGSDVLNKVIEQERGGLFRLVTPPELLDMADRAANELIDQPLEAIYGEYIENGSKVYWDNIVNVASGYGLSKEEAAWFVARGVVRGEIERNPDDFSQHRIIGHIN